MVFLCLIVMSVVDMTNNKSSLAGSVMLLLTTCDPEQDKQFIINLLYEQTLSLDR